MLTELTFAILKYGFLILLWIFVACTVRSLYKDIETFSPRKSRAHRRKERRARKAVEAPAPVASAAPVIQTHSAGRYRWPACRQFRPSDRQHHHLGSRRVEHRGARRRIRLLASCTRLYRSRNRPVGHRGSGLHQRHCGQPAAPGRSDDSRFTRSGTYRRNHL